MNAYVHSIITIPKLRAHVHINKGRIDTLSAKIWIISLYISRFLSTVQELL